MSERQEYVSEAEWEKERERYGMSLTPPSIPKGTQPFEDWELNLIAQDNNEVVFRSEQCDRFIATIRELQMMVDEFRTMTANL